MRLKNRICTGEDMTTNKRICLAVIVTVFVVAIFASAMPVWAFAKTNLQQSESCESIENVSPLFDDTTEGVPDDAEEEEPGIQWELIFQDENFGVYLILALLGIFSFLLIISILVALSRR